MFRLSISCCAWALRDKLATARTASRRTSKLSLWISIFRSRMACTPRMGAQLGCSFARLATTVTACLWRVGLLCTQRLEITCRLMCRGMARA